MDSVDLLLQAVFGLDPSTLGPVVDRARPSIQAVDTRDAEARALEIRRVVLEAVELGYQTLAALGPYAGLPRTTLRVHVANLVADGSLVERKTDDRSKRGRPKFIYTLSDRVKTGGSR